MQSVMSGYRGLSVLVGLNWDRFFILGTIIVGLLAGAFLGTARSPSPEPARHCELRFRPWPAGSCGPPDHGNAAAQAFDKARQSR